MPLRTPIVALLAALLLAAPAAQAVRPFVDLSLDEARAEAASRERLLLVKGDADWCKPCKRMDKQTFGDPRVIEWLERYAVAISVDVDKEQDVAAELRLMTLPALVVLREGVELDRSIGFLDADALLAFLEEARLGRSPDELLMANFHKLLDGPDKFNLVSRYQFARDFLEQEQYEIAAEEFVWLWNNGLKHDPAFARVRLRFMPNSLKDLIRFYPPARDRIIALRQDLEPRLSPDNFDITALDDLTALSISLDDKETALDRIDELSRRDDAIALLAEPSQYLFEFLIENDRWPLAGEILADPEGRAQRLIPLYNVEHPVQLSYLIHKIGDIYAALLSCGRVDEAEEVAQVALDIANTPATRRRLKQRAELAGLPYDQRQAWTEPEE